MRSEVVLLEREVRRGRAEDAGSLAGREALKLRDVVLDDKAAARFELSCDGAEALSLLVLAGQIRDRVAHQISEPERVAHSGGREVPYRDADLIGAWLRSQSRRHSRGQLDPVDTYTSTAERQREATGADAEFESSKVDVDGGARAPANLTRIMAPGPGVAEIGFRLALDSRGQRS
jgi:hypothetical protein